MSEVEGSDPPGKVRKTAGSGDRIPLLLIGKDGLLLCASDFSDIIWKKLYPCPRRWLRVSIELILIHDVLYTNYTA